MKPINKTWTLIACCISLNAFAPLANAAGFMYFIDSPIVGESTDPQHQGWTDVLSVEWSLDAANTADKRGSGEISDIVITTASDASSPYLALAAMQSKSIGTIDFEFVDDTGRVVNTLRLSDVKVMSGTSRSQRDGVPTESWTLNYTKVQWTYFPVDREQAPSEFIWTRAGN